MNTHALRSLRLVVALLFAGQLLACATNLGTGESVYRELQSSYPIAIGRLVAAQVEPSRRLKVYLQLCEMRDVSPIALDCKEEDPRLLAIIESSETKLLKRFAQQYLPLGQEMPVYVYGPSCDGLGEMILIPRCQRAVAISVWDPHLRDYIVYSTMHGDTVLESSGFENLVQATSRITGVARRAAKLTP